MIALIKKNYKLYLFILLVTIGVFSYVIFFNKGIFIFDGDTYEQTFKFYLGGWEKVRNGSLGGWDWSLGFGGNILSYSLYFISSPVFWFSTLFDKSFMPYILTFSNIIQLWLGFIFTHFWLSKLTDSKYATLIGSFVFTFCGWTLGYMRFEFFLLATMFYPLILYLTEIYFEKKRFLWLCISIGLLGISNYLLLYQFIPFLLIYALIRYILINRDFLNFKSITFQAIKFFSLVILGVFISSIVLLPNAYLILNSPRFSNETSFNLLSHYDIKQLYKVITSLFTPVFERQNVNYFISTSQHGNIGWGGGASLYGLIITPILLPLLLKIKDKFKRNTYLITFSILSFFLFFKIFSVLFNFSLDTRWFYMFVLMNTLIVVEVVTNIENGFIKKKYIYLAYSCMVFLITSFLVVSFTFKLSTIDNLRYLIKSSVLLLIFGFVYIITLSKKWYIILLITLSIEVCYCGYSLFKFNKPVSSNVFVEENLISNAVSWINEFDSSFYRIMYDLNEATMYNDSRDTFNIVTANEPLSQGFKGTSFYTSLYNTNQEEFLNRFKSTWLMPQLVGRDSIYNLLSAKYFYTYQNNQPVPYKYYEIYSNNDFTIYENPNYVELGFACKNTINRDAIINLSYLEQDRIMQSYCITEDSNNTDYSVYNDLELLISFADAETRIYEFEEPISNKQIYVENFGIPHLEIYTYYNDNQVNYYDMWQYNYSSFTISDDQLIDKIIIKGIDEYGYGTMVNLYQEDLNGAYESNFKELTANHFTNVVENGDTIEADITITEQNEIVFTSIPYDRGWSVYVDNTKIDFQKVNLGFIGFKLEPGEYHISFKYEIPLFKAGIIISLASLTLLFFLTYINKRNKNKL